MAQRSTPSFVLYKAWVTQALIPSQLQSEQGFTLTVKRTRSHSHDSSFKNISIYIVLQTAGALFDMPRTSAFYIYFLVMGKEGFFFFFVPFAMRKL